MSSSGLIYAFIVGAWAVYLVPMWLRREDELNTARQTQRYTTAIKVLSHKDSFERKHGAAAEQAEARALPLAVGQAGSAPAAGQRTLDRVRAKERAQTADARGASAAKTVSASVPASSGPAHPSSLWTPRASNPANASGSNGSGSNGSGSIASGSNAAGSNAASAARSGLRARRRRVVSVLFGLSSLGALVSADLGLSYVWAMLLPAAVLSAYIVRVRKDERARAAERARRRAVAAKAAREAERRRVELEREQEEAERLEREELARRNAVARRRVAAARSRADRRTAPGTGTGTGTGYGAPGTGTGYGAPGTQRGDRPDPGDLPRAANG
ncbi:MAG TPA: hypothetical protein VH372_02920 [Actinospica sp.]|nr:hypothetical protein [Actinospica sp.]